MNLTDELEGFVQSKIESGRYESASDVVQAALRNFKRDEREYNAKIDALRAAIDEGEASGLVEGNPFERVRAAITLKNKAD